jgi:hypothetical protein
MLQSLRTELVSGLSVSPVRSPEESNPEFGQARVPFSSQVNGHYGRKLGLRAMASKTSPFTVQWSLPHKLLHGIIFLAAAAVQFNAG